MSDEPTPIRSRRKYTPKVKAAVAGIAAVVGVTEAERQTGVPKNTIQYWLTRPEFVQLRTTAREDFAAQMWAAAQELLASITESAHDAPLRDRSQALDTIMAHHALLTGGATSRSEHRDLTATLDDHERQELADAIDGWLEAQRDHAAADT